MFSPLVVFSTQEIICYIFLDIFHGLIIPMKMEIPWKTKASQQACEFYVRKPVSLESRPNDWQSASPMANTNAIGNVAMWQKRNLTVVTPPLLQYDNYGFKISELEREQKALKEILQKNPSNQRLFVKLRQSRHIRKKNC